jgi:hypothetical protein
MAVSKKISEKISEKKIKASKISDQPAVKKEKIAATKKIITPSKKITSETKSATPIISKKSPTKKPPTTSVISEKKPSRPVFSKKESQLITDTSSKTNSKPKSVIASANTKKAKSESNLNSKATSNNKKISPIKKIKTEPRTPVQKISIKPLSPKPSSLKKVSLKQLSPQEKNVKEKTRVRAQNSTISIKSNDATINHVPDKLSRKKTTQLGTVLSTIPGTKVAFSSAHITAAANEEKSPSSKKTLKSSRQNTSQPRTPNTTAISNLKTVISRQAPWPFPSAHRKP